MQSRISCYVRRAACLTVLLCLSALWSAARADVTIKQTVSSRGLGGFMDTDMKIETMISGDKQCENSEVMMNNKLMAMFGAGSEPINTSTITRLDKDLVWEVMHADKMYSEEKLSVKKARMEQYQAATGDEEADSDESGMGMGSDEVEWGEPTFSVENTGKTETIAGYKCDQSIVKMDVEGKQKDTGEPVMLHLTMDLFMAKDVPGLDEMMAFSKKEATALGEDAPEDMSPAYGMLEMLSEFGVKSEDVIKEAEKIEGYPFRMTVEMRGEGGQFDENPSGMSAEDQAKMEEAMEAMKNLGEMFGASDSEEADESEEPAEESEAMAAESDGTLFKVTTEVTGLSTDAIKAGSFEPPSTYKKVSMDSMDSTGDDDGDE